MEPRKKPTPSPVPRATGPIRGLAPARQGSRLPTVAALLAATASLALVGCRTELEPISGDRTMSSALLSESSERRSAESSEPANAPIARGPREHDPAQPLPGMGAFEPPTPQPLPEPSGSSVVKPPTWPYPVKGGAKAVHPTPVPPPAAGGLKPASPPIPPPAKPPKLSGDVAMVMPETT